jgi:hypothetical protein
MCAATSPEALGRDRHMHPYVSMEEEQTSTGVDFGRCPAMEDDVVSSIYSSLLQARMRHEHHLATTTWTSSCSMWLRSTPAAPSRSRSSLSRLINAEEPVFSSGAPSATNGVSAILRRMFGWITSQNHPSLMGCYQRTAPPVFFCQVFSEVERPSVAQRHVYYASYQEGRQRGRDGMGRMPMMTAASVRTRMARRG